MQAEKENHRRRSKHWARMRQIAPAAAAAHRLKVDPQPGTFGSAPQQQAGGNAGTAPGQRLPRNPASDSPGSLLVVTRSMRLAPISDARAVAFFSVSLACGNGNVSFNGTIRGQSFAPSEAISGNGSLRNSTSTFGVIELASPSGICQQLSAHHALKNAKYFSIDVRDVNPTTGVFTAPTAPGTYTVRAGTGQPPAKWAGAVYIPTDANCLSQSGPFAVSGTVTITSVSNGSYSGNFDLILDSGDHVSGSFNASNCAALTSTTSVDCI